MTEDSDSEISDRKRDHLDLTTDEDVEARGKSTLLEEVDFFHDSLPELELDAIDLTTNAFGERLDAPLLISGMTGGADRAKEVNRTLARVAQELGIAFGVGSQRALFDDPSLADTYQVRDVAPDITLLGNIGAVQAAEYSTDDVRGLIEMIGADALAIHLNPGQELIQPEGDRDFRGCVDGIGRLVDELDVPVIAKETGSGLGPPALDRLARTGIEWVGTSGAGGTTWIGVETLRAPAEKKDVGDLFWDWGTPTAASIVYARRRNFHVVGSGGLRSGLDVARAIALGARLGGMALPWLRAAYEEGYEAALRFGRTTIQSLKTACMLTGSETLAQLRGTPIRIGSDLQRWMDQDPTASDDM